MQHICNPSQPGVSFLQILSLSPIFLQSSIHLKGQPQQVVGFFRMPRYVVKRFGNGIQLLIACQTAPVKRLATAAIDRIPDRLADLRLDLSQFNVSGRTARGKRGGISFFLCF